MAQADIQAMRVSAEGLYDSAVEMAEILEVFEHAGFPRIDSSTMQRMEHNVINARRNLADLATRLGIPETNEQPDRDTLDAAAQLAYAMALE